MISVWIISDLLLGMPNLYWKKTPLNILAGHNGIAIFSSGMKGKMLSAGAKLILLKHVLQALPLYYNSVIAPPPQFL